MHGRHAAPPLVEAWGQSDAFLHFQEALSRVAAVDRPVLLVGERGTGKELAAARLHYLSRRWDAPYVTLDCAALAPSLAEAELFGHEAGAFTGAGTRRPGRFERADGGTLFLDEAGNIPFAVQDKLLRVVEYGHMERVGGVRTLQVDVRVVAATNADLPALVRAGLFRADLLDRLSFEVLTVPPLRARGDDILLLANRFAEHMASELDIPAPAFSSTARAQLLAHPWPGNIRELKNTVERAVCRCETGRIERFDLDPFASPWRPGSAVLPGTAAPSTPDGAGQPTLTRSARGGENTPLAGAGSHSPHAGMASPPQHGPHVAAHVHAVPAMQVNAPASPCGMRAGGMVIPAAPATPSGGTSLAEAIRALEEQSLLAALTAARHNRRVAAELLGLTYDQFRGLYRRHQQRIEGVSPSAC